MSVKISSFGGFGTGALGNVAIASRTQINSYAKVTSVMGSGYMITISNQNYGAYGRFAPGEEVMLHISNTSAKNKSDFGLRSFAHITSTSNNVLTLDAKMPVQDLSGYTCQVVSVPNFGSLTVSSDVVPMAYNGNCGGIIAFRVSGALDISRGRLLTEGCGMGTGAKVAGVTDRDLSVCLPLNEGNGAVFVVARTITMTASTRLGASWSGALGVGAAFVRGSSFYGRGGNGGAGYGGGGAYANDGSYTYPAVSASGTTGGRGGADHYHYPQNVTNGGARGYNSERSRDGAASAYAGATVALHAVTITGFTLAALSTGGQGGNYSNDGATGGGGGGYAYIAVVNAGDIVTPTYEHAYTLDALTVGYYGCNVSKDGVNLTTATDVLGFTIDGQQPNGTERKVAFSLDAGATWGKLSVDGNGVATLEQIIDTSAAEYSNKDTLLEACMATVLEGGNTVAELSAVASIPSFVGKRPFVFVALSAPDMATQPPTLSLGFNISVDTAAYGITDESSEYKLKDDRAQETPRIIEIVDDITTEGQGTASVQVSLCNEGVWSAYMALADAAWQQAEAVKFRAAYNVLDIGKDKARVNSVTVIYSTGTATVTGDMADLCTVTQNYENGLSYCHALVKHQQLIDGEIKAYVSFRNEPQYRKTLNIGNGTGKFQTLTLGVDGVPDPGINQSSLSVMLDGKITYDYSYNTITSELTITAPLGVAITASYEYGWDKEVWNEMRLVRTEPYKQDDGIYSSEFVYELPSTVTEKKTISDVKIELYRPTGTVTNEQIGIGTGSRQVFALPHKAKKETVACNAEFSYDEEAQLITVVAEQGAPVIVSYDWIAEIQTVYGFSAGWAAA